MLEAYLAAAPYFGWDLVRVVQELFRYAFMQHAFEAGTIVGLSAGVIGYFVVLRSLSFAAHALSLHTRPFSRGSRSTSDAASPPPTIGGTSLIAINSATCATDDVDSYTQPTSTATISQSPR